MSKPLSFQQVILKLHEYWSDQGCVIWEPYNVQVGAGTGNPATLLRVLGPEPWRVAYVEPSVRPDDGRFGENPNRMQKYYQYQVILKPDPGNPQDLYLESLEALGISPREHDIRFVEDNWDNPALGAWGLGWEVWLDGQEITQYTYFQQAGGLELDPVSVEITYGIERIVLALQDKTSAWDIDWMDGGIQYRDVMLQDEIEHCMYYFDIADIKRLHTVYNEYISEHKSALQKGAIIPAYDYVLKCSHLFNILDTRGAIGVTERATFFRRMRDMTRNVAKAYTAQREGMGHPLMRLQDHWQGPAPAEISSNVPLQSPPEEPADILLEIGVEELPASDVHEALHQLWAATDTLLENLYLEYETIDVYATPRRLVIHAVNVAPKQPHIEIEEKGPPANRAFDADGNPTKAAQGFAQSKGVDVSALRIEEVDGGQYVMVTVRQEGRYTVDLMRDILTDIIANLKFGKNMRWNHTHVTFSRPIRWIVALFGDTVIPFTYADVASGNVTRGLRSLGSLPEPVADAADYHECLAKQGIILSYIDRKEAIAAQIIALAGEVGGSIPDDPGLLDEVTNLVEAPTALRGTFDEKYLQLPPDVLVTVMRKHQRYFPMEDQNGALMPYFVTIRNGDDKHLDQVIHGNVHVLGARFSDADFFYKEDLKKTLKDHLPRLSTLTFEEHLGSMLDKNNRVAKMIRAMGEVVRIEETDVTIASQAAEVAKADLATQMVIEMTSLQGTMGREYALKAGLPQDVATAIFEHWLPRFADDILPSGRAGVLLGITDRLDSLVGLFAAGFVPKSTADPYGLRRAALSIIQVLVDQKLDVDLIPTVDLAAENQPIPVTEDVKTQLLEFITTRLRVWLGEQGWQTDLVTAVLAEQSTNPYRASVGVGELKEWVKRDGWQHILDNFARCVRITRGQEHRYDIRPEAFETPEEEALYFVYKNSVIGSLDDGANVHEFLAAFEPMVPVIEQFFDKVLVNTDDVAVRQNRLGLLQAISNMQKGRADLSQLSGF